MILPIIIYVSDEVDCKLYLIKTINPLCLRLCKLRLQLHFAHVAGSSWINRKASCRGVKQSLRDPPWSFLAAPSISPPLPLPYLAVTRILSGCLLFGASLISGDASLLCCTVLSGLLSCARVSLCLALPLGRLSCHFTIRGRWSIPEQGILTEDAAPGEVCK